jgi:hypothetical protein
MMRCRKAKPGKQRRAHDEKPSKKRTAAWEALVGSFTSIEPEADSHNGVDYWFVLTISFVLACCRAGR